jgi:4-hydroxybenzoate polyprenyltransferase
MAVNRLVDAAIDARNPRTAGRELPAGRLRRNQVVAFALASLLVFAVGVSQLAPITRWLAPLVIVPMVIYPYLKRYTPLCHLWLGAVDGLAPVGGWVAVTGHFDPAAWLLGAAVACWIAGFDIIYATMDIEVDRAQGLHSIPADYGVGVALRVSRALHALSVVALAGVGLTLGLGPVYAVGVVAVALLLAYEQHLVSPTDLSRVNMAFLNVNGVIALLYLGAVSLDVALS